MPSGVYERTAEHGARISAALTGKKHTNKAKAKISATLTGKKHTAETIAKRSASNMGKKRTPKQRATMKAAQNRPEVRAKISAALTGKKPTPETRAKCSTSAAKRILKGNGLIGTSRGISGYFYSEKNDKELFYRSLSLEYEWYKILDNPEIAVDRFEVESFSLP